MKTLRFAYGIDLITTDEDNANKNADCVNEHRRNADNAMLLMPEPIVNMPRLPRSVERAASF